MAGLFDKQAAIYADARPKYSREWFSMLAALTPHHSLAWDVGTGNGQAAIIIAEHWVNFTHGHSTSHLSHKKHYDKVIATDISKEQLSHGMANPRVDYLHAPLSMPDDEVVSLVGGENSVDLVTISTVVHLFDLERFYSQVKHVLKKPGGFIAVWTYRLLEVNSEFYSLLSELYEKSLPLQNPKLKYAHDCYKTLPFPFESVGVGCEGQPVTLDMKKEVLFQGMMGLFKSVSTVNTAQEKGVDLLSENVIKDFETAWGGSHKVRTINFKTHMLAGKVKI